MPPTPATKLAENRYGKSGVRVMKVQRGTGPHTVKELTVDISLTGDFDDVHRGDNSACLPTDTMKNTVYALAKSHPIDSIESFALHLAQHFLQSHKPTRSATVSIAAPAWLHAHAGGQPYPHFLTRSGHPCERCEVTFDRAGSSATRSGFSDLTILKTADSAFSGYPRDRYTTLKETEDRLFCTSVAAWWTYTPAPTDFNSARAAVYNALLQTFATHNSKSVQHTLHDMGHAALAACPQATSIRLTMPNKHCLLADLSPFALTNDNEVFIPTDEPYGLIEATIARSR